MRLNVSQVACVIAWFCDVTCSTAELPRRLEPKAGLEPATASLSTITQSCDPSKMAIGQEPALESRGSNPLPLWLH